jgi:hypothetical protein
MNPDFQVYAKILKFALIYRNEEGTGLVLTVLQDWCKNLYEGKQPSWYGSVKHILQNMSSLTNFLTDKTSTFKYKCNKIVKQHYLNEEGTGLVLTVLQDWCFFYALPKEIYRTSSVTFHNVV